MTKIAWIVAGVAIATGLGATFIPLPGRSTQDVQAQEMAPAPAQPEIKAAPATPIAEKKAELGDDQTWNPLWDEWIEKALPPELLSPAVAKAVKPFCPRFTSLSEVDKRTFWAYFFQALAGAEAGLVPTRDVRHMDPELQVKDDVTHRMVRQQGLLQLTYMDQERYGCDFDWEKDKELDEHDPAKTILQPRNNLLCGVNIIRNQLIEQHRPLLSSNSYFSTLQPGTISIKVFLKQMANVPAPCGQKLRKAPVEQPVHETAASMPPSSSPPTATVRSSFASQAGPNTAH